MPRTRSNAQRKHDDDPVYLTEDGLKDLHEQLARLKKSLPGIIAETQRTAAYGDRSDNAEYKESKALLRRTHRHVARIEDQVKRVMIITSDANASGTVHLGSTVVLEEGGTQKIFHIVGPHETDPSKGRISHRSPLGTALIGHRKDDVVALKTQNGLRNYRILEIR